MSAKQSGRSITAFILIGLGAFFLLNTTGILSFSMLSFLWPFFIILPGGVFLYFAMTGNRDMAGLAIPGWIITGTDVYAATGHYDQRIYVVPEENLVVVFTANIADEEPHPTEMLVQVYVVPACSEPPD